MKSSKTMVAILVTSAMGLTSMAANAAPESEDGASQQQSTTERADRKRDKRSNEDQSTKSERQSARQQRQSTSSSGRSDTSDEPRAERSLKDRRNRERRAASAEQRRNERRQTADRWVRDREPRNQDAWARGDFGRTRSNRRNTGRQHANNGRAVGSYADRSRANRRGFEDRVDRRMSNQRARIYEGRKTGDLTRKETRRLRKDQKKIARMDRRFGNDGRYTRTERRKLNKALDRSSKRVYRAKHNDRIAHRSVSHKRRR